VTVILETVEYEDEIFWAGIAEIGNTSNMGKDALVNLASEREDDIHAIQFLDSSLIVSIGHLLSAAQNAVNAWKGGYMLTRGLDAEVLVYASAQRQIGRAIENLGIHAGLQSIALVVIGGEKKAVRDVITKMVNKVGKEIKPAFVPDRERLERIMHHFGVNEKEIKALTDSDEVEIWAKALSKCVVSRVSIVALGA
jgi:tRNA threonylcarbamoyladenosine modification (KEOPS) complex Cgi121 subunit